MSRESELEIKVAFLEQSLEQLSDEYYRQQQQIIKLQSQTSALIERLRSLQEMDKSEQIINDKPPHY